MSDDVSPRLRVEVQDQGPGLTPEQANRVFEKFFRIEDDRDVGGGTGLGLSIVERIVEHHGGEVGVDSEPGHGATFWFELPLTARREEAVGLVELETV